MPTYKDKKGTLRSYKIMKCVVCGKSRKVDLRNIRKKNFTNKCANCSKKLYGKDHPSYKGGWISKEGYKRISINRDINAVIDISIHNLNLLQKRRNHKSSSAFILPFIYYYYLCITSSNSKRINSQRLTCS